MDNNAPELMRAKILGRLNCMNCKSFHGGENEWCRRSRWAPRNNKVLGEQYCEKLVLTPCKKPGYDPNYWPGDIWFKPDDAV